MAAHARSSRVPSWVPFFNPIARLLLAAGVPMGPDVLITVRGRKSGLPRTTPVTICENSGRRGLISPFGEVNWVRNLRAAGRATITVGRLKEEMTAVELGPTEAGGHHSPTTCFFSQGLRNAPRGSGRSSRRMKSGRRS